MSENAGGNVSKVEYGVVVEHGEEGRGEEDERHREKPKGGQPEGPGGSFE